MIFASGSALQVLLHHGIVPDFQVEKENNELALNRLRYIFDLDPAYGALKGTIPLLASATVHPEILDLFGPPMLFFRDSVSSTRLFGDGYRYVFGIGPYAANSALTMAGLLGFREVYLFGTDCGTKEGGRHHSEQTYYYTGEKFAGLKIQGHDYTWPGNFGGTVETNASFQWSRQIFEQIIALYGIGARNCSDGILIEGAAPTPGDSVSFAAPPLDKARVVADIMESSEQFAPGGFFASRDTGVYGTAWERFDADFSAVLDTTAGEDADLETLYRRVRDFLAGAAEDYHRVSSLIAGSALALPQLAQYYLARMEDPTRRAEVHRAFVAEYARLMKRITAEGKALFDGLEW